MGFLRDLTNCDAFPIRRYFGAFCRDNLGHFLTKVIQSVPQNPIGEHTLGGRFFAWKHDKNIKKAKISLPKMTTRPIALTIAGFDPGSGAGITADLKTFSAHGIYGVACISALTVQSTLGVRAVEPVSASLVRQTLECLAEDVSLSGIKIGMLGSFAVSKEVASFLSTQSPGRIVLDPVLRSTSGTRLVDVNGIRHIREEMLNRVGWITPNVDELAILIGEGRLEREQVPAAAVELKEMAARQGNHELNVVVTGGHLDQPDDFLLDASGQQSWLSGEKVDTNSTHGTGCAFSSALLCGLISGLGGHQAVAAAKAYVTEALRTAFPVGKGKGPINHLFRFDP